MFPLRFYSLAMPLAMTLAVCTTSEADSFQRLPRDVDSVVDCVPSADVVVGDVAYPQAVRAYRWSVTNGLVIVGTRGTNHTHCKQQSDNKTNSIHLDLRTTKFSG